MKKRLKKKKRSNLEDRRRKHFYKLLENKVMESKDKDLIAMVQDNKLYILDKVLIRGINIDTDVYSMECASPRAIQIEAILL